MKSIVEIFNLINSHIINKNSPVLIETFDSINLICFQNYGFFLEIFFKLSNQAPKKGAISINNQFKFLNVGQNCSKITLRSFCLL